MICGCRCSWGSCPEAVEQGGEAFVDAGGAVFQSALKAGAGDDAGNGNGQSEDGGVECFGDADGDACLCIFGAEDAEDVDQPPGGAEDAEHGGDVGDDADECEPAAPAVNGVCQSRFCEFFCGGLRGGVEDAQDDLCEGIMVLQAVFPQGFFRIGGVLQGKVDLGEGALPASAHEDEVVEDGGYQQDGAGQKRVTEGLAGIKELADGFRHGVRCGLVVVLIEIEGEDEFQQLAYDFLPHGTGHGGQGGAADGAEGEGLLDDASAVAAY